MSDNITHLLNHIYNGDNWVRVGQPNVIYSREEIESKLSEWFPLCCFDKLMQEAAKENIRLTVEKDEIELADEKEVQLAPAERRSRQHTSIIQYYSGVREMGAGILSRGRKMLR